MKFKVFNKIIFPVYIYLIALFLYFTLRGINIFVLSDLNEIIFYLLIIALPFLLFFIIYFKQRKIFNGNYNTAFLFTALIGFIPGATFGIGLNAMAHGNTIFELVNSIFYLGIPFALIFGMLGVFLNIVVNFFIKKK